MTIRGRRAQPVDDRRISAALKAEIPQGSKRDRAKALAKTKGKKPDPMTGGLQFGTEDKPIHLPDRQIHTYRDKHGVWHYKPVKDKTWTSAHDPKLTAALERESRGRIPGNRYKVRTIKDLKPGDLVVAQGIAGKFKRVSDRDDTKILVEFKDQQAGTWFDRDTVRPADGVFEEMGYLRPQDKPKPKSPVNRATSGNHVAYAGRTKTVREPPPANAAETERRIKDLLTDLKDSSDPQEKKRIRSRLRSLGHTGGLNGSN